MYLVSKFSTHLYRRLDHMEAVRVSSSMLWNDCSTARAGVNKPWAFIPLPFYITLSHICGFDSAFQTLRGQCVLLEINTSAI